MPAALAYGPPNSAEWKQAESDGGNEQTARITKAALAWRYYIGEHDKPLNLDSSKIDDNMIINLVGLIIDKGVSALFGTTETEVEGGVKFQIIDEPGEPGFIEQVGSALAGAGRALLGRQQEQEPDRPEQTYLDIVWRANKKNILLHDMGLTGGALGHVFSKIDPGGTLDPETGETCPRIINLDPSAVLCFWDGNDYDTVLWYRIDYLVGKTAVRQDVVNGGNSWGIYNYQRNNQAGENWKLVGEEEWRYPLPPIVDWKNLPLPRSYYGMDDVVQNSMRLNDGLNFIASNVARILKHHASPKSIGTGFTENQVVASGIDNFWTIAAPDAKVYNLEMQSDLRSSLDFMQILRRATFDGARELDPSSVQDQLGNLTNFALRVLYNDTLAKGGTKRLLYGDGLTRLNRTLLMIAGFDPRLKLSVDWPEPLPTDPLAMAQALQIDVTAFGLSKDTALEKRGYDPEQEAQRRETEQFERSMNTPPQLAEVNQGTQLNPQMIAANNAQGNGNNGPPTVNQR